MNRSARRATASLAVAAVCATFVLAACTPASPDPSAADTGTDEFVACLQAAGLDTRVAEDGRVLVKVPIEVDSEGMPERPPAPPGPDGGGAITLLAIDGAVYAGVDDPEAFDADWGITPIYAECQAEVPGFEQPDSDLSGPEGDELDPELAAAQTELLLAFAECARESGLADFPDPDGTSMLLPGSMSEEELRSLLTECGDLLADSEAPLAVSIDASDEPTAGDGLGRVFTDFPELTDHGLTISVGVSRS